jgi:hypothetical protein
MRCSFPIHRGQFRWRRRIVDSMGFRPEKPSCRPW